MKTILETSEQHFQIIEAAKSAKSRNNELAMQTLKETNVMLLDNAGKEDATHTIKTSLQALTIHGYSYSDSELNRVVSLLNSIN
jgi:hypothetical protein